MTLENKLLKKLGKIVPEKFKGNYRTTLNFAGCKSNADKRLGIFVLITLTVFLINLPLSYYFLPDYSHFIIPLVLLLFPALFALDYLLMYFKVEDRRARVENVLPDFLHLISSSLRAGLTPYQALKSSAREEFGPLKDEIEIATTKAIGSESFEKALMDIKKTIDSKLLERVINLFITSLYSGSHRAQLMEETAKDMAETKSLKKELSTGTKTYTMFILFTVVIGSPLLFAISLQFIDMVEDMNTPDAGDADSSFDLGLASGEIPVTSDFIFWLTMFLLVSTSIFSSILMGVIKEGNKKYGLRYAPIIIFCAIFIFFIARKIVAGIF